MDRDLNCHMTLTSANSINVARFLPQAFYYFYAYAQLKRMGLADNRVVVCVPSGNFGNITAASSASVWDCPSKRFIAANNRQRHLLSVSCAPGRITPRAIRRHPCQRHGCG
jgi:threonine synthase